MRSLQLYLILGFFFLSQADLSAQRLGDLSGSIIRQSEESVSPELNIRQFRYASYSSEPGGLFEPIRSKPGYALLSSAVIPGSAQAANGKWLRAGVYFLTEIAGVIYYFDRQKTAERQERDYIRYANAHWSVVSYAQWLVNYSQANNLDNGYMELQAHIAGQTPSYSTSDWNKVNLGLLQRIESRTPFVTPSGIGSNFSHTLPGYGSQQYYELISKYYQFQAGWSDFEPGNYVYAWDGSDASDQFRAGVRKADRFNDNYRRAGNILNLILINHVVSAFDGYFTVKLKNSRIEAEANLLRPDSFSVIFRF